MFIKIAIRPILYIILTGCVFLSCHKVTDPIFNETTNIAGTYNYFAYDSSMNSVAKGWFTIDFKDSINFSGEWSISQIGNPANIGPQDGNGELDGSINDTSLYLNFNPNSADHNVFLIAKTNNQPITGNWQWVTLVGITNQGFFKAVKK